MKAVRIFNPLHVLCDKISVSHIDGFKILSLYKVEDIQVVYDLNIFNPSMSEHPEIRPQIEVMKTEVMKYQPLAVSIQSFEDF